MEKTTQRLIAEILDDEIRGRAYGVTRIARQLHVTTRTIDRWCSEESTPSAADLLNLLGAMMVGEPERAIRTASRLLRLVKLDAHRAEPIEPTVGDAIEEAADVTETAAALQHVVRESRRDGVVSAEERTRIVNAARRVERETHEVVAVVASLATAERSLALGGM
jgi:transcriptional regulator with XRE-family HTH domain